MRSAHHQRQDHSRPSRSLLTSIAVPAALTLASVAPTLGAAHATLSNAGIEITQDPVQQPYGIDFGIRDPFGNHVRISQPNA
ncbi:MAG: hypothetical protein JWN84_4486 [Nocardioides sp.]|nr:hypothetical protein [Nocardioides sp.]